jgi:N-dimethylarginine dimethylaminohydrolase
MTAVLSEYDRLARVLVKHPREAFVSDSNIAAQWKPLNFSAPPDFSRAVAEYDRLLEIIADTGCEVVSLPRREGLTLDSIYTRDAAVVSADGVILARMGKASRSAEPAAQREALRAREAPIAGVIARPGCLEGGDLIWLDQQTAAVGLGSRTNSEGIRQLKALLGDSIELIVVPLPDYPGLHDVMHLMSLISPVGPHLAVIYPRLLPDEFRQTLLARGYRLVAVPDDEFETMGGNVLALAPMRCVMLGGNPKTRAALEAAGARVHVYDGMEISLKGGGGPTCLTRPLERQAADS